MTFLAVEDAIQCAKLIDQMIYVELEGIAGTLQVYPGGRTVLYPPDSRISRRITPESIIRREIRRAQAQRGTK